MTRISFCFVACHIFFSCTCHCLVSAYITALLCTSWCMQLLSGYSTPVKKKAQQNELNLLPQLSSHYVELNIIILQPVMIFRNLLLSCLHIQNQYFYLIIVYVVQMQNYTFISKMIWTPGVSICLQQILITGGDTSSHRCLVMIFSGVCKTYHEFMLLWIRLRLNLFLFSHKKDRKLQ